MRRSLAHADPQPLPDYFQDRLGDDMMPLSEAAKLLPSRKPGRKVSTSCLYRWASNGCRGVILETWSCGSARVTSREAVARFVERLTRARQPESTSTRIAEHAKDLRAKKAEIAGRLLDGLGFKVGGSGE